MEKVKKVLKSGLRRRLQSLIDHEEVAMLKIIYVAYKKSLRD